MNLPANKFDGKARHSDLMNRSHMKKREFAECIASLAEREALRVDTEKKLNNKSAKIYVLNEGIIKSWRKG